MKLAFSLGTENGSLTIQREDGDRKVEASGFTRKVHGWGAEIHLLGMLAKRLNSIGFDLVRRRLADDGHMYGDDHMKYLKPRKESLRKSDVPYPYIYIIDGNYMLRSSAEAYNKGEEVCFNVHGDCLGKPDDAGNPSPYSQPDWFNKVKALCDAAGIPCELSIWCFPARYEVIYVLVNYFAEGEFWNIGAYGCKDRESTDDPDKLGDTEEAGDEAEAIQAAEMMVWRLLNSNKARRAVILLNGNEHSTIELDERNRPVKVESVS